jgi:hypothetical protein
MPTRIRICWYECWDMNVPCSRCSSSCIFFNSLIAFDAWAYLGSSAAGIRLSNASKASDNVAIQRGNLPASAGAVLFGSSSDGVELHCKECVGLMAGIASAPTLGVSGRRAGVFGSRRAQALVTNKETFSCVKASNYHVCSQESSCTLSSHCGFSS